MKTTYLADIDKKTEGERTILEMLLVWDLDGVISQKSIDLLEEIYIKKREKITHNEYILLDDQRFRLKAILDDLDDVVEYYSDNIEDEDD